MLLPGPTDSWRSYQQVLDRLPADLHVIAVSQRGHGDSDKPASGYRVEDFAADVVDALDVFAVDRALLVGHSGSCLVARRVALDHPERVAGLFLESSPSTLRGDPGMEGYLDTVVSSLEDPIDAAFARSFVTDTSSDEVTPEQLDQLVEEVLKVPARVWQAIFSALLQYDDLVELGRIDVPTRLVWGERDALVPSHMQDQLLERIGPAELLVYPGVGHTPRWEDPSRFSTDLAAFARSLGSTSPTRSAGG